MPALPPNTPDVWRASASRLLDALEDSVTGKDRRAAIIPVNIRGKTLSLILITLIALTAFLFVIGALWGRYDFPDLRESGRNAAHLNRRIQEAFQQQTPIRYDMRRVETKRGERHALT